MPLFIKDFVLLSYFIMSIVLLLFSFVAIRTNSSKLDNIFLFFGFILITIFYGVRFPGTTDIKMYLQSFNYLSGVSDFYWGYGFYYLFRFIKWVSPTADGFIFLTSLFFTILLLIFVCLSLKGKPYKTLMLITLFYGWYILDLATNTYRQGVAVCLLMIGFLYLLRRNYISALLLFCISLTFHWGAIFPMILCVMSTFISKNEKFIKGLTLSVLVFFMLSFFIDFNIASQIAKSSLVDVISTMFFNVNLVSKVDAYLNASSDGTMFYESSLLRKIKFTIEAFFPLLINAIFMYRINKFSQVKGPYREYYAFSAFIAMCTVYCLATISMAWFFRNFYWMPLASALCMMHVLIALKGKSIYLISYIIYTIALSILTIWTSELLAMSYPS